MVKEGSMFSPGDSYLRPLVMALSSLLPGAIHFLQLRWCGLPSTSLHGRPEGERKETSACSK